MGVGKCWLAVLAYHATSLQRCCVVRAPTHRFSLHQSFKTKRPRHTRFNPSRKIFRRSMFVGYVFEILIFFFFLKRNGWLGLLCMARCWTHNIGILHLPQKDRDGFCKVVEFSFDFFKLRRAVIQDTRNFYILMTKRDELPLKRIV